MKARPENEDMNESMTVCRCGLHSIIIDIDGTRAKLRLIDYSIDKNKRCSFLSLCHCTLNTSEYDH